MRPVAPAFLSKRATLRRTLTTLLGRDPQPAKTYMSLFPDLHRCDRARPDEGSLKEDAVAP
jgi:hypothetical protein